MALHKTKLKSNSVLFTDTIIKENKILHKIVK